MHLRIILSINFVFVLYSSCKYLVSFGRRRKRRKRRRKRKRRRRRRRRSRITKEFKGLVQTAKGLQILARLLDFITLIYHIRMREKYSTVKASSSSIHLSLTPAKVGRKKKQQYYEIL